jgi:Fic family protein
MATYVKRRWEPETAVAGKRESVYGFTYEAYLPDAIAALAFAIPLDLASELEATSKVMAELQHLASTSGLEALSRQLLRAESIGSSRIEGLQLSQRRLARAMVDPEMETDVARAIIGNIQAMDAAITLGSQGTAISIDDILALHRALLLGTRDADIAGVLRDSQNWIGGTEASPRQAEFIPPPETEVGPLLLDLCAFMNRDDLPAILQAGIAHAQFETIHPFADGNGRVGRALVHVVLKRRGLTPTFVPPVSLVLATNAKRYVENLTAFRSDQLFEWCRFFIRTLYSATEHAKHFNDLLLSLQQRWREAARNPRKDSAAEKLIQMLPAQPVLDLGTATSLARCSQEAARNALNDLEAAGVLSQAVVGKKKNRIWEARELLTLVDHFEWELATPTQPGQQRRPSPQPTSQTRRNMDEPASQ